LFTAVVLGMTGIAIVFAAIVLRRGAELDAATEAATA
jgi:hypothetical protein